MPLFSIGEQQLDHKSIQIESSKKQESSSREIHPEKNEKPKTIESQDKHEFSGFSNLNSPSDMQLRELEASTFFASEFVLDGSLHEDLRLVADRIDSSELQKNIELELGNLGEPADSVSSTEEVKSRVKS